MYIGDGMLCLLAHVVQVPAFKRSTALCQHGDTYNIQRMFVFRNRLLSSALPMMPVPLPLLLFCGITKPPIHKKQPQANASSSSSSAAGAAASRYSTVAQTSSAKCTRPAYTRASTRILHVRKMCGSWPSQVRCGLGRRDGCVKRMQGNAAAAHGNANDDDDDVV